MDVTKVVAENARSIREGKKLTLDGAAALTGVSRSMLAQIEKGEVNPTISVLWKMANGYKVSFTTLVEPRGPGASLLRRGEPLVEDEGRYWNYPAFAFDEKKLFETYRILIRPGGNLTAQPHLRGAEEYLTVFQGQVEVTVAGEVFLLEEGDSLRFRADVVHGYCNRGREEAALSMLIYYNGAQRL